MLDVIATLSPPLIAVIGTKFALNVRNPRLVPVIPGKGRI